MFYVLPDNSQRSAKQTKRGQHLYAVALKLEGTAWRDGSSLVTWVVQSEHLTAAAGRKAFKINAERVGGATGVTEVKLLEARG